MGEIILAIIIAILLYFAITTVLGFLFRKLFSLIWTILKFALTIIFYPVILLFKLLFGWMR